MAPQGQFKEPCGGGRSPSPRITGGIVPAKPPADTLIDMPVESLTPTYEQTKKVAAVQAAPDLLSRGEGGTV